MLNRNLFRLFFISLNICYACCDGQVNSFRLVWSDEFGKDGMPDTTVWNFENGFVRNHEDQWYQPENACCKKGKLIIEARQVHLRNPHYQPGSNNWKTNREWISYTSASINTAGRKSWQYGRFVMRAKMDTAAGLWPAFWTLGINGEWPSNGEIDIMEYYRGNLLANVATGTGRRFVAHWFSKKKPVRSFGKKWSDKFHVWRMDWDSSEIKLYVDDYLMNKVPLDSLYNPDGSNPFRQPHYILLNMAVGGDNGGSPASARFPRKYEIDYVRIYQKR